MHGALLHDQVHGFENTILDRNFPLNFSLQRVEIQSVSKSLLEDFVAGR